MRSHAASENAISDTPGIDDSPFWPPVITASMPHASISSGIVDSVHTASTTTSAPAAFASAAMSRRSRFHTVFDVSPCTIVTISGRSRAIASAISSRLATARSATSSVATSAPTRVAISAIRALKKPLRIDSTRVPRHARFEIAISIAAEPGPATPSTHFVRVWNT